MIPLLQFLAQNPAPGPGPTTPQGGPAGLGLFVPILIFFGVFMYFQFRGQRKEQAKKKALLESMKKNDRVLTIGGIVGTIAQVKEHEVILKIDEANNTKMTVTKRAIQTILADDDAVKQEGA
jgi:preprotein translocase subunit YajC